MLARFDVPAALLQLEITEDTLMVDTDRAVEVMSRVRALSVEFALDDLGTGTRRCPTSSASTSTRSSSTGPS